MTASDIYSELLSCSDATVRDDFDRHAVCSIFALAAEEALKGGSLNETTGLNRDAMQRCIHSLFPSAEMLLARCGIESECCVEPDEQCIKDLMLRFRSSCTSFSELLAALIARRAMQPNHLWQDLGLKHRAELSQLMQRHFAPLALRNKQDMKWKKFFFRMICREDGFSLCSAPVCSECADFAVCFGDESGESRMARARSFGSQARQSASTL